MATSQSDPEHITTEVKSQVSKGAQSQEKRVDALLSKFLHSSEDLSFSLPPSRNAKTSFNYHLSSEEPPYQSD